MSTWRAYLRDIKEHLEDLRAMGITELVLPEPAPLPAPGRRSAEARPPAAPTVSRAAVERAPVRPPVAESADSLERIAADLADCRRCRLCEKRKHVVFGVGNPNADIMFVGEGPGEDEDRRGEPFVGAAGELLTKIIEAMTLRREDVYIANVVKCRPPNNRTPLLDEVEVCYPFLRRQIGVIKPKVIVCLGVSASQALLGVTMPIGKLRGNFYKYGDVKVMPTFHPAYLLRTPAAKPQVWSDIQMVMAECGLERANK